jgi:mono/diheme cytochrome c family protein
MANASNIVRAAGGAEGAVADRASGRQQPGRALRLAVTGGLLLAGALLAGCRQDMHDTPRYEALEESDFFADKRAMRPIPAGTVARGNLRDDDVYYTGKQDGEFVRELPPQVQVDKALLDRGEQRFNIYCAPCHSPIGDGNGTIVQRGYKRPVSYHDPRLRGMGIGYFYDVITNGFGQMPDYAAQVTPADRWAIAAYIRVLQRSQTGTVDDVPADQRGVLEGRAPASAGEPSQRGGAVHD